MTDRFVGDVLPQFSQRLILNRLFQKETEVLDRPLQIPLIIFKELRGVVSLQTTNQLLYKECSVTH
jgi:hypothetical protein